jgi:transposase
MVANPRATKKFAEAALQRGKTDALDSAAILEFARRMPFREWTPPASGMLELRSISRRIEGLVKIQTQEKNRLHATIQSAALPEAVREDLEDSIQGIAKRVEQLRKGAVELIRANPRLSQAFDQVRSVRGIAEAAAIQILGELLVLPKDMTARQWVAHAGLDPRQRQSGTSLHAPSRISKAGNKHLRRALYMPALVSVQWEPQVRAFYEHLTAQGKTKMQANIAVMRKLLHAIFGMLRNGTHFDGQKFYAPEA